MRRRATATLAVLSGMGGALLVAGCSQSGIGATGIGAFAGVGPVPYQHASAFMPVGFSESLIGQDRYRIEVKGPLGSPRERMEKIALTRAAEIGKDAKHKYFKVEGVQVSNSCKSYVTGGKPGSMGAGKTKVSAHTILTADVTFAPAPADPSFLETRGAFERYRAELDQDQTSSPPVDPSTAQCG